MKALKYNLDEAEQARDEKSVILKERTSAFSDKVKRVQDLEAKVEKLQSELKNKHKDLESKLDTERKKATDLQLKYTKLEEIYEIDRQKLMTEKEKFKIDLLEVRKRNEETGQDFDKLKVRRFLRIKAAENSHF